MEEDLTKAVNEAVKIKDHLSKDILDKCGYCGQLFGPDDVVIHKEIYGQKWAFCDETCYSDFHEKSNFKDENLDEDKEGIKVEYTEEE